MHALLPSVNYEKTKEMTQLIRFTKVLIASDETCDVMTLFLVYSFWGLRLAYIYRFN